MKRYPALEAKIRDDLILLAIEAPDAPDVCAKAMLAVAAKFLAEIAGPREALKAVYQVADSLELPAPSRRFCAQVRGRK